MCCTVGAVFWASVGLLSFSGLVSGDAKQRGSDFKNVVEYEGNIFVLHSGCPEVECQRLPQLDYCKKYKREYEECMRYLVSNLIDFQIIPQNSIVWV